MTRSLPDEKLAKAKELINNVLSTKKTNVKTIQKLTGYLICCLRIIPSGRPFLRRLYDLTKGNKTSFYKVRISEEIKQDLLVWKMFFNRFDGKTLINKDIWSDENTIPCIF